MRKRRNLPETLYLSQDAAAGYFVVTKEIEDQGVQDEVRRVGEYRLVRMHTVRVNTTVEVE